MESTQSSRRQIYWLIISTAFAAAAGRILSVERLYEPSRAVPAGVATDGRYQVWLEKQPRPVPTFGSNDRSRWDTVRALVDEGTFVIGRRDAEHVTAGNPYGDYGIAFEDGWTTIDKVLNPEEKPDRDGKMTHEYYSSKPPLPAVLMAGEYWLIKHAFGWSINEHPFLVVRIGLLTFNAVPFFFYLCMIAKLAERHGLTDWGGLFVVVAASFGTLLTPFLITFNNHVLAAFAALAALHAVLCAVFPETTGGASRTAVAGRLLAAGAAAGLLVNFELPAAAFVAALGLFLFIRTRVRTLLYFLPPLLLLIAISFLLNHLATGQWTPVYEKIDTPWYQYEGGIWATIRPGSGRGIEFAKYTESRGVYAFNLLFGHHGWFSLTPVNLLGMVGMIAAAAGFVKRRSFVGAWNGAAVGSLVVSLVVFVFYAFVVETANYGGWTNGPRWLLWLTPLWLFAMLPVADWLGRRRWGRVLCILLLGLSVLSASYTDWNPWRHPWIYNGLESNGWLPY